MKKLFFLLCFSIFLSGCTSNEKITQITASVLLPQETVAPYLDYTPDVKEKNTRQYSITEYLSNPRGKYDPVIVKVYQVNGLLSEEDVLNHFNECKDLRSDAFTVDGMNVDCFVAYPSIHYYTGGYHVQITAGSGSDNDQKILLMNLAKISLENLDKYKGVLTTKEE